MISAAGWAFLCPQENWNESGKRVTGCLSWTTCRHHGDSRCSKPQIFSPAKKPSYWCANNKDLFDLFLGLDLKLLHRGRFRNLFCRNLTDFLSLYRNRETEILKGQIDFLNDAINREEERAKELEMKSKYGSFLSPLFHFSSFAQSQHQYTLVYLNFCKGNLTLQPPEVINM